MWTQTFLFSILFSCALAQVQPRTKPNLSVLNVGGNIANLEWTVNFPAYGTLFFVEQATEGGDFELIPDSNTQGFEDYYNTVTSYTYQVNGLEPSTTYQFRIIVDGFPNLNSDAVTVETPVGLKVCGLFPLTLKGEDNPAGSRYLITAEEALKDVSAFLSSIEAPVAFEFNYADTLSTKKGARTAMRALAADHGCKIFIGPYSDKEVLAVKKTTRNKGYTVLTPGAISASVAGDGVFLMKKDSTFAAHALARKMRADEITCLYSITGSSDYDTAFAESVFEAFVQTNLEDRTQAKKSDIFTFNSGSRTSVEEAIASLAESIQNAPTEVCTKTAVLVVTTTDLDKVLLAAFAEQDTFIQTHWYGGDGVALNPRAVGDEASSTMARLVGLKAISFIGTWNSQLRNKIQNKELFNTFEELEPEVFLTYDAFWLLTPEGILDGETPFNEEVDDLIHHGSTGATYATGEVAFVNYMRCAGAFGIYEIDSTGLTEVWGKSSYTNFYDCDSIGTSGETFYREAAHRFAIENQLEENLCIRAASNEDTLFDDTDDPEVTIGIGSTYSTAKRRKTPFGTSGYDLKVCRGTCTSVCRNGCEEDLCSTIHFSLGLENCNSEAGASVSWSEVGDNGLCSKDSYSLYDSPTAGQETIHTVTLYPQDRRNGNKVYTELVSDTRTLENTGAQSCSGGGKKSCSAKGSAAVKNKRYKDYTPEVCALQKRTATPSFTQSPSFTSSPSPLPTATPTQSSSPTFTPSFTPSFTGRHCEHFTEMCLENSDTVVGTVSMYANYETSEFDFSLNIDSAYPVSIIWANLNDDNTCSAASIDDFLLQLSAVNKVLNQKTVSIDYRDVYGPACGNKVYGQIAALIEFDDGQNPVLAYNCLDGESGSATDGNGECNDGGSVIEYPTLDEHCCIPPTPTPTPTPVTPECQVRSALTDIDFNTFGEVVFDPSGMQNNGKMPLYFYGTQTFTSYSVFLGADDPDVYDITSDGWITYELEVPHHRFEIDVDVDEHAGSDCNAFVNFLVRLETQSGDVAWAYGPYEFGNQSGFTFKICCLD